MSLGVTSTIGTLQLFDEPMNITTVGTVFSDNTLTLSMYIYNLSFKFVPNFGYAATVIHDACATRDQEFEGQSIPAAQVHAAYMAALAFAYANVVSTEQYLKDQR